MSRRELLGGAAILALLVALFHGPALGNGFVYDDHWTIVDNPFLASPGNVTKLLGQEPARAAVPDAGRPTLLLTEFVDRAIWGLSPRGPHLQNLLWHLAVACLFFAGLAALTEQLPLSLTAAAVFAVHPLNVEAVAAINYREDLLAAFFVLAALASIGATRQGGAGQRRALGRAAAFLLVMVGGFAKENAVVAPILLVLLDVSAPSGERAGRRLDQLVLAFGALVPVIWRAWAMGGAGVVSHTAEVPAENALPWLTLPRAAWSFVCGLGQFLWPQWFAADYPAALDPPGRWEWLALLALISTAVFALRARHAHRWLALAVLAALVGYLPTMGLVPISNLRADRYFYLPSLGLSLGAAWMIWTILPRLPGLRGAPVAELPRPWLVIGLLIVALGLRTRHATRVWHDDLTLWTHTTAAQPTASRAWTALGESRLRRGQLQRAQSAVEHSLMLAEDPHARELLGLVLLEQGQRDEARVALETALTHAEPHHRAEWLNNLGYCELLLGRLDQARAHLEESLRLAPGYQAAAENLRRATEKENLKGSRNQSDRPADDRPDQPDGR